jgi:ribosome-binding factor A
MSSRKISRRDLLSSCAQPGPDDGRDPRLDRRSGSGKVSNRKALQLCAQVARALTFVFAGCGDDVLRNLVVESVTPAPNASRLLVRVASSTDVERSLLLAHLEHAHGMLRSEVASAINRRRAPDLVFRIVTTMR